MDDLQQLTELRKDIHKNPELSKQEVQTAARVTSFLQTCNPDQILGGIGGHGVMALYDSGVKGPALLFRSELDALAVQETNNFAYASVHSGISHKCGHDGHTAIVAGIARWMANNKLRSGKVGLLFQPAEETGSGAAAVLNSGKIEEFKPDYVFALHNVPGYPMHQIICRPGTITPAVKSMIIRLLGKTSHAAEPEKGINPAMAISRIISLAALSEVRDIEHNNFCLITPVHINMGEPAYGVSAGYGEVHLTMRTLNNKKMQELTELFADEVKKITRDYNLDIIIEFLEDFFSTKNDPECARLIQKAALTNNFDYHELPYPFKWGEDFGLFTERYRGALFGLGAGEDTPNIHNPDFDFPDILIKTGIQMFTTIIKQLT